MQNKLKINMDEEPLPKKHLVLHFDLNKTILTIDPYDNIPNTEYFVWDIIARMAWGEVIFKDNESTHQDSSQKTDQDYREATWVAKSQTLSQNWPEDGLISYRNYLDKWFVYKPPTNDEEMDILTHTVLKERNELLVNFFKNEGKIFKCYHDKVLRKLKLPENSTIKGNISNRLREIYENKRFYTIPAFFRTLIYLRKIKRNFSIMFRTHGRELPYAIEEFNNFCEGNHPAFNGEAGTHLVTFNGTKAGSKDYRINSRQTGMYFRFGRELSDVNLILNSIERYRCDNHDQLLEYYGGQIEEGTITHHKDSIEDNYALVMNILRKHGSAAISDDHWAYTKSNLDPDFGKLFWIDQYDYSVQHIFFDDCAISETISNIDVRDLSTNLKILEKKYRNKYVVRANIYEAIIDPDYFIKMINIWEENRDNEIERLQLGILSNDEDEIKKSENEWDALMKLPNEEYILKTVAPLLYQGLTLIATERPQNPIEFLSLFMLQNQHLVNIPKPSIISNSS